MNRNRYSDAALRVVLAGQMAVLGPAPGALAASPVTASVPSDDATAIHVLNRLTFGPSEKDLARVRRVGVSAWIEEQLRPSAAADTALATRLAPLETLQMDTAELRAKYEIPPDVRQQIQKARAERDAAEGKTSAAAPGERFEQMDAKARREEREAMVKQFPQLANLQGTPQKVVGELQAGKVLRAAYAERQLDEVMADFWFNHFNVFARKGPVEFMIGDYERGIRERAFGKFEDLLVAVAQSPAMLFYLDNWQSVDPGFSPRDLYRPQTMGGRPRPNRNPRPADSGPSGNTKQPPRRAYGINENYARELMELHTLGVDGGYTQADVVEVAKAFTGWTILGEGPGGPRRNKESRFAFAEPAHVKGDKHVLGFTIRNGGEKEGLEILHLLATHPSTAKFISRKLVQRFVADRPPQALVDRAAATFTRTGGDIREVLRTIFSSEEFLGPAYRSAKIKTPFEFVVSSVRATGAEVKNPRPLSDKIGAMGMPLYLQQPPTGYKDAAEEWVSTSSLLERMNFALDLAAGRVRGVSIDQRALNNPSATLDSVAAQLLPGGLSPKSKETLEAEAAKDGTNKAMLVGLVLGSPEFQRK
ncbi:MAG: DUF1800 domain-containing protein [Vicinamibacteria bacterium]|nr:DUF1800 domain-containing protein [Vicinamibacteria bacterium]